MNKKIEISSGKDLVYKIFAFISAYVLLLFLVHNLIGFIATIVAGYYKTDLKTNLELYTVVTWGSLICSVFLCGLFLYGEKEVAKLQFLGFSKLRKRESFYVLLGIITVILYCIVLIFYYRLQGDISVNQDQPKNILLLLMFGILSGISEELVFRGYLLKSFLKHDKKYAGVLITSAVFALMHILNPKVNVLVIVSIFLIGCLLSIVTIHSKSIYFALSFHISFNFLGLYLGIIDFFDEADHSVFLINRDSVLNSIWYGNSKEMIDTLILIFLVSFSIILSVVLNGYTSKKKIIKRTEV